MEDLFYVFLIIISLFFFFLIVKSFLREKLKENFCVICFSVILTWISLIFLYWQQNFNNQTLIGILIGMSVLGIFYFVEGKIKKDLYFFKLPFLLTLIFLAYIIINIKNVLNFNNTVYLLLVVWFLFLLIYFFKNNLMIYKFFNKIVECCKKI